MSLLSEAVTQAWYQNKKWIWLLLPLTVIFWLISHFRRVCFRLGWFKSVKVDAPVIIVGNISVGGTGKSPLTGYLVSELKQRGFCPGVVSRGYGGQSDHYPLIVDQNSSASEVGDEPVMLYQMTQCPVAVDPIRSRAAKRLCDDHSCDVILCDDGLQHYALSRDIELCVIDGKRGLGNGFLLPAGPLRESYSRIRDVDFVIVNGKNERLNLEALSDKGAGVATLNGTPAYEMTLRPTALINVFNGSQLAIETLQGLDIHAMAGIGNPERFFAALRSLGANVTAQGFSDHHDFTQNDFSFEDKKPIVMTHKDAVKCRALFTESEPDNFWYLPVSADINKQFIDQLCERLALLSQ
ncbi:tetraacyldisaccharide 4'-kinase [Alkalimarinus alittae]|uniref:Tetraacyldisaccharide 4'-kinase n=1 Tax=Alkalimarinus alittae TaxID=2961619 RepID=A0ABY6N773_9ALTE|nr:tetraacyldisaccharide 4'-kinase [Alkalimarinus alittae]UZE97953.1 tetraacyldisaccharide 4'-kinase [Alkalimarinus alittae]